MSSAETAACSECGVRDGHRGTCSRSAMRLTGPIQLTGRAWFFYDGVGPIPERTADMKAFVGDPVFDRDHVIAVASNALVAAAQYFHRWRWITRGRKRRAVLALDDALGEIDLIRRTGGRT